MEGEVLLGNKMHHNKSDVRESELYDVSEHEYCPDLRTDANKQIRLELFSHNLRTWAEHNYRLHGKKRV